MSEIPEIGKISSAIFNELIYPRLGAKNDKVIVGPQHGVDVGIVEVGNMAMSITCDPVFIVPEYGWERAAWFAIHIIASDSVTSGLKPAYLSIDLNLPLQMTKAQLTTMWEVIHQECLKYGINIITGHTARYSDCHYPMVGGATIIGIGELDEYVTPRLAKIGDAVIVTKGPAIEASGIFAAMFPKVLENKFGSIFNSKAQKLFYKMSVVEDALTAVSVGMREKGVTSMHDATECGVWGGLWEIGQSSGLGIRVDQDKIVMEDCVPQICEYFGIDPFASISEGTLLLTCRSHAADAIVKALHNKGINSSVVGELTSQDKGMIKIKGGKETKLEHPIVDPFWKAFYGALEKMNTLT
jgi:hydrogenase expression/formation protein HypE